MGVLAVYGVKDASTLLYYGLHNLQHRGQEGGGMATFDENGVSYRYRGLGLLNEVFKNGEVKALKGNIGIGCVKYANASRSGLDNVCPLYFRHRKYSPRLWITICRLQLPNSFSSSGDFGV